MKFNAMFVRPLLLATTLYLNACQSNLNSLSPSADAASMSNASITVSVVDGAAPVNGKTVALIAPDGSKQVINTGSGGNATGEAKFEGLIIEGRYSVGFEAQASVAPALSQVYLSAQSPQANVTLQAGGSALLISPAPFQNNWYPWASQQFNYTLTYSNDSALQADLALSVDANSLPSGWSVSFSAPMIKKGESVTAAIFTSDGSLTSTANVKLLGNAGAIQNLAVASLSKGWSITITRNIHQRTDLTFVWPNMTGTNFFESNFNISVTAKNLPSGVRPDLVGGVGLVTWYRWSNDGVYNPPTYYFSAFTEFSDTQPPLDGSVRTARFKGGILAAPSGLKLWAVRLLFQNSLRVGHITYPFSDEILWQNANLGPVGWATTTY